MTRKQFTLKLAIARQTRATKTFYRAFSAYPRNHRAYEKTYNRMVRTKRECNGAARALGWHDGLW